MAADHLCRQTTAADIFKSCPWYNDEVGPKTVGKPALRVLYGT